MPSYVYLGSIQVWFGLVVWFGGLVWFGLPVPQLGVAVAEDGAVLRLQQGLVQTPAGEGHHGTDTHASNQRALNDS